MTSPATLVVNSSNVCSVNFVRPPIISRPGGSGCCWSSDCSTERTRRRIRLRVTAGPNARLKANATHVAVESGSGHQVHHRADRRIRVPSRANRSNAERSRIRWIKPRDGRGPWRGGSSARRGHRACSCVRGTRASLHGGVYWVEMYASRRPPGRPGGMQCRVGAICHRDAKGVRDLDLTRLRPRDRSLQPGRKCVIRAGFWCLVRSC